MKFTCFFQESRISEVEILLEGPIGDITELRKLDVIVLFEDDDENKYFVNEDHEVTPLADVVDDVRYDSSWRCSSNFVAHLNKRL